MWFVCVGCVCCMCVFSGVCVYIYIYIYGCMFGMLLFNTVNYVFLLLRLRILIVMYVPFWVLFHCVLCIVYV